MRTFSFRIKQSNCFTLIFYGKVSRYWHGNTVHFPLLTANLKIWMFKNKKFVLNIVYQYEPKDSRFANGSYQVLVNNRKGSNPTSFVLYYYYYLMQDLDENEKQRQAEEKKIGKYEDTIEYLETVVERPRWNSLLKVSEKVYIPGFITHTGEYMVEMPAHPNSYKVLYTAEQTMAYLNKTLKGIIYLVFGNYNSFLILRIQKDC